ncbi:MAG TPA: hypothetical protein VGU01_03475 [Sphingomicrobium sp.]|nr:hypothetical protein [Sphingomicrobium sp.]
MTNSLAREAAHCRKQARQFEGRPEQPFLLRLSEAFDELSLRESSSVSQSPAGGR